MTQQPNHSATTTANAPEHNTRHGSAQVYRNLAIELSFEFVAMFLIMYAMIASLDHYYFNLGNVYMTLMMVAAMALIMLIAMRKMYPLPRAYLIIVMLAVAAFAVGWFGTRAQAGIGNEQFARAMIPHHSGAILMCREAQLTDPELVQLCREIISAQEREIAQMKRVLSRL